jgi:signal transduction histidine kinase
LHGAALVAQLRTAREDLLRAREEEHRRLRRDLHDDLAPTLAGLGMRSAAVATLISTNPARQLRAAEDWRRHQARGEQVREIAYDLRPRCSTIVGWSTPSATAPARRHAASLAVTVEADDLGPFQRPSRRQRLRIVSESVANVRRHAHASTCRVSLRRHDGNLHVEIIDDGHGIATGAQPGIGLTSIADRAAELGGRSQVCSNTNGTVVRVWLPIEEPA